MMNDARRRGVRCWRYLDRFIRNSFISCCAQGNQHHTVGFYRPAADRWKDDWFRLFIHGSGRLLCWPHVQNLPSRSTTTTWVVPSPYQNMMGWGTIRHSGGGHCTVNFHRIDETSTFSFSPVNNSAFFFSIMHASVPQRRHSRLHV